MTKLQKSQENFLNLNLNPKPQILNPKPSQTLHRRCCALDSTPSVEPPKPELCNLPPAVALNSFVRQGQMLVSCENQKFQQKTPDSST